MNHKIGCLDAFSLSFHLKPLKEDDNCFIIKSVHRVKCYLEGVNPPGGIASTRGQKSWKREEGSRRRRRREKFLGTFLEIFGKVVNKDAIESDFWGSVGRYNSKISKNTHFWEKNTSTIGQKFWDISTKVPGPPRPKITLSNIIIGTI